MIEKLKKKLEQLRKEQNDLAIQYKKTEQMLFKYDGAIEALELMIKEEDEKTKK